MAIDPIPARLLERLAAEFHPEVKPEPVSRVKHRVQGAPQIKPKVGKAFDLPAWIAQHIPDADGPRPNGNGGQIWVSPDCVFRSGDKSSMFIIQLANGAISAGCQHDTCLAFPQIENQLKG
jgi:hypothetical protein